MLVLFAHKPNYGFKGVRQTNKPRNYAMSKYKTKTNLFLLHDVSKMNKKVEMTFGDIQ